MHLCHSSRGPGSILTRSSRPWARGHGRGLSALRATLKRDVAIKVLPENWSRDPERLRRFEQEAQATAALNHANIVSIFHVGQYDGLPDIVTELLQGETLRDRLRNGPMRLQEVLDFGGEIASRSPPPTMPESFIVIKPETYG